MTEACIHLVGAYREGRWPWRTPKHKLDGSFILQNVKSEAAKLATECAFTSLKLFQTSIHVEEKGSTIRVSIQSSKDSWAAVALCLDWLATSLDEGDDDPVKKGAVYRKLHKGGNEYLPIWQVYKSMQELGIGFDHEELAQDMTILKDYAKETVEELCTNNLVSDVGVQF